MFIVDEKPNKWAVGDVSEATAGATTNSVAQIVSGNINSGAAGMISNPRFIVGRRVESSSQLIIRAIFIFLTHSQQSTVNNDSGVTGIDITGESGR